ncbi:unnamed protein product [Mycena citricolor]|uniref:Citrate synthase n=1 Tax=Mycena citricolor TaxID=2018698 RepID=A0AAD2H3M8_9AGAR|nr:unnamed protein product [Mycena citricolor]
MVSKSAAQDANSLTVRDNRTGKTFTVPIVDNSISAVDFKAMKAPKAPGERDENETEKGLRVADKGFLNTAVLRSQITYIDGEAGVLRYRRVYLMCGGGVLTSDCRGYPIEQLALHSSHLETGMFKLVIYALSSHSTQRIFSSTDLCLRNPSFKSSKMKSCIIPSSTQMLRNSSEASGRYDAHPMAILTSAFAYIGSYYSEANPSLQGQTLFTKGDKASLAILDKQIYRLIGKATTLAAMAYRVRQGREFVTPPTGLSYTGSFLYQMDYLGQENYAPNPVLEKALDVLFLLHADHEMNASASSVMQVGSSLVDPYSAIAAGCASLYGPLHGGANEAVIRMLISIGKPENVPAFIEAVKRREKVLSGFGHRVYKTSDPRSFLVRKTADEVFKITGKDELLQTAMALHDAAMKDEYFIKRKLAPNVDFCCSGLIYRAMGFPNDYFPVLFAVPRVVGWLAHWRQASIFDVTSQRTDGSLTDDAPRTSSDLAAASNLCGSRQARLCASRRPRSRRRFARTALGRSPFRDLEKDSAGVLQRAGKVVVEALGRILASCQPYIEGGRQSRLLYLNSIFFYSGQLSPLFDIIVARQSETNPTSVLFLFLSTTSLTSPLLSTLRKMFATLVSLALIAAPAIRGVAADLSIATPALTQCGDAHISWTASNGPYNLILVNSTDPCGEILSDLGDHAGTHITWKVNYPAKSTLMLSLEDKDGNDVWSQEMVVADSSDTSCLNNAAAAAVSVSASQSAVSVSSASAVPVPTIPTDVVQAAGAAVTDSSTTAGGAAVAGALSGSGHSGALSLTSSPIMALCAVFAAAALAL